ncbi:MAG: polyamine ABC transporter ATP-binding protein [Verrucomicrobia bacterium RIFCSPHIGHO2_12_FULL_41_10]|nr:MAG: polyamine ABC transporter ATP-binding protein [Verrucomicrobia bacterium RIFCSPHIGHO2_12_FULL_41_10]HLB33771.1 ATP-binding cassette domain-containing protein [Chthoniobacterales bacterium]
MHHSKSPVNAIEVNNLTCGYGETIILKKLSFSVPAQELLFIIGGSGCGKSTLLRSMIGLLPPEEGKITYFGKNFIKASEEQRRDILKSFGVLYQSSALWSSMTVGENIALPLEQYTSLSKQDCQEVVALKLAQVGLSGIEDLYPRELSGGMKKRMALARALALDPKIVFFDEPSEGLDPITSREIDELILEVRETLGTTIVIVSHQLSSIFRIADRVLVLDHEAQGIIADGPPKKLARESTDLRVRNFLNQN